MTAMPIILRTEYALRLDWGADAGELVPITAERAERLKPPVRVNGKPATLMTRLVRADDWGPVFPPAKPACSWINACTSCHQERGRHVQWTGQTTERGLHIVRCLCDPCFYTEQEDAMGQAR